MTVATSTAVQTADTQQIAEANPHYAKLNNDQRFWYRMAMLDASQMLISDLAVCEDLDFHTVCACVDAIHEWHKQLFELNSSLS
jgi:hypothetical protein